MSAPSYVIVKMVRRLILRKKSCYRSLRLESPYLKKMNSQTLSEILGMLQTRKRATMKKSTMAFFLSSESALALALPPTGLLLRFLMPLKQTGRAGMVFHCDVETGKSGKAARDKKNDGEGRGASVVLRSLRG